MGMYGVTLRQLKEKVQCQNPINNKYLDQGTGLSLHEAYESITEVKRTFIRYQLL